MQRATIKKASSVLEQGRQFVQLAKNNGLKNARQIESFLASQLGEKIGQAEISRYIKTANLPFWFIDSFNDSANISSELGEQMFNFLNTFKDEKTVINEVMLAGVRFKGDGLDDRQIRTAFESLMSEYLSHESADEPNFGSQSQSDTSDFSYAETKEVLFPKPVVQKLINEHYTLIKAWREYRGIELEELAKKLNMSKKELMDLERSHELPDSALVKALAKELRISEAQLVL